MTETRPVRTARAGRVWLDLILAVVLVVVCWQLARPAIRASRRREALQPVAEEAHALFSALQRYHERNGGFPDVRGNPPFEVDTLEPLRRRGYYHGNLGAYLLDGRVDAYDAPDDRGPDKEFWVEMTLASDPAVRILIAKSDDAPLGRGAWVEGVYLVRDGRAEPL